MEFRFVDLHNHLTYLTSPFPWICRHIFGQSIDLESLMNFAGKDCKGLCVLPFYALPFIQSGKSLMKSMNGAIQKLPAGVKIIKSKEDLEKDFKLGLILQVESLRWVSNDLSELDQLVDIGVRSVVPIHFVHNKFGGSCDGPGKALGLTELGVKLLEKMNQLPLILDLTHMNDQTFFESLNIFKNEVMVSHTGIREAKNLKRNITLEMAQALLKRNGLIGMSFWNRLHPQENILETIQLLIRNGFASNISIGSDLGAPFHTAKDASGIPKFLEKTNELPDGLASSNAIKFFQRALL